MVSDSNHKSENNRNSQLLKYSNLYAHFPYCESKCHYCDFFSLPESKHSESARSNAYSALINELKTYDAANAIGALDTLFMGGGTPSLAPLPVLEIFLKTLKFNSSAEVTMEANPSSVTKEKAKVWKELGINRISLGVQALNNERLFWLGRVHDKKEIFDALDCLFDSGITNISTDYIVGVAGQTTKIIQDELSELYKNFPDLKHTSAYLLTLKTSNPKFKELLSENEQLDHLRTVRDTLASFGFEQYEISNFAKNGFTAKHNENYWLGGSYLGVGPSAHSFDAIGKKRFKNTGSLSNYIEELNKNILPIEWTETLTAEQEEIEFIMLRLRRKDGVNLNEYQNRFHKSILHQKPTLIAELTRQNLIETSSTHLKLSKDGFFVSDLIIQKLIS